MALHHNSSNRKSPTAPRRDLNLQYTTQASEERKNLTTSSQFSPAQASQAEIESSKRPYSSLADYAEHQGAPESEFIAYGWDETIHKGRPAFEYPTDTGKRWRYLDGQEPRHDSPTGYKPCWYGLERALEIAGQGRTLVLVNGAAGVIVAQYHGIPAFAVSDGEARAIPKGMIEALKSAGITSVTIAQDCDKSGRAAAARRARQLIDAGFIVRAVDLQLGESGDIANFCKAHGRDALARLADLPTIEPEQPRPIFKRREVTEPSTDGDVDWSAEHDLWWRTVVLPLLEQRVTRTRRKHFSCIFPELHNHGDKNPSARISTTKDPNGIYVCQCGAKGAHSREAVAERIGAPDFKTWWKDNRQALFKKPRKTKKKATPASVPAIQERVKAVDLPALPSQLTVNTRYISEIEGLLKYAALLIKSAIGTGKTELVKRIIAELETQLGYKPRILVITHRQALAADIARRLDIECYKNLDPAWIRSAPQLVIVANSLHHLARVGETLPCYDMVVIDEVQQFHRHWFSGTFRNGQTEQNHEIARQLAHEAKHVIALDAHASAISQDWLTAARGDVTTLVNTYRLERGALTLHAHQETVIQITLERIEAGQTPVVIATSSRRMGRKIQHFLIDRLGGDEGIRLICSDNSESQDSQAFIDQINTELPKLKCLIYSPSLGTGIDITAYVPTLLGVFGREPLDARDCLQMLGRCRNVGETHVYIPASEGSAETDAAEIYWRHEQNAIETGRYCQFDEYGIYGINPVQQSLLKLQAFLQADHNRLTNDPLSWFVALAQDEGYTLTYHDGENHTIAEALKQVGEQIAEADKEAVLAAESVSYEEMEAHRRDGTLTPEVRAGHERFKIEDTVGQAVTPEIYADLHKPPEQEKLRRFTDLLDTEAEMKERDRKQAADEHLLSKRGHYTRRRALVNMAIRAVFGDAGIDNTDELIAEEIETRIADFLTLHMVDIKRLPRWRADLSQKPVAVFKWLLAQSGIKIASRQVMRDRQRFYVYFIDRSHLEKERGYAVTRLAHLAQLKAKAEARADYLKPGYRDISRPPNNPCHKPPLGGGWREITLKKPAPRPLPTFGRLSKHNPFSKPLYENGVPSWT